MLIIFSHVGNRHMSHVFVARNKAMSPVYYKITILPQTIILTKAHRSAVSMMVKGCIVARVLLSCRMSILINCRVTLSNLRVMGPMTYVEFKNRIMSTVIKVSCCMSN